MLIQPVNFAFGLPRLKLIMRCGKLYTPHSSKVACLSCRHFSSDHNLTRYSQSFEKFLLEIHSWNLGWIVRILEIRQFSEFAKIFENFEVSQEMSWVPKEPIRALSVLDRNLLATEANAGSLFKCKWYLSLYNAIPPHEPPFQASPSPIPRTRIWPILSRSESTKLFLA